MDSEVHLGYNPSNLLGHRACGYVLDWRDIYPQFEVKKFRLCRAGGNGGDAAPWQNIVTGFEVDTYMVSGDKVQSWQQLS